MQTCIVHLICASLRWVNYKDPELIARPLQRIYDRGQGKVRILALTLQY